MKVLIDMNLSPYWTVFLADAGFEAAHWSRLGPGNARDSEILAYARTHHYVVLTHDLDFGAILAATHDEKPSVIRIRAERLHPDLIGKQIVLALRQMASELEQGALLTVDPERTRLAVAGQRLRAMPCPAMREYPRGFKHVGRKSLRENQCPTGKYFPNTNDRVPHPSRFLRRVGAAMTRLKSFA